MIGSIDEHFVVEVSAWADNSAPSGSPLRSSRTGLSADDLLAYFDAQIESRHLDFAARELQKRGEGFYTIGSAGHESNAAVARALRPTDPALLHYRSGGFYAARAAQVPGSTPIRDVLLGMAASIDDPISGGRHKVFGNRQLNIIPQTSTIASHLPRAVGVAFAIERAVAMGIEPAWPADSVVVCSFGDASANHSTATGAINSAGYCGHRHVPMPILFVCEDNGIGISTKTPAGWMEGILSRFPGVDYLYADGSDPEAAVHTAKVAADKVRATRRPAILHLKTMRFMGHAGSDAELGYRTRTEILRDYLQDPILHTALYLLEHGVLDASEILARYESMRDTVMSEADRIANSPQRLASAADVARPIAFGNPALATRRADASVPDRGALLGDRLPEDAGPQTLAQSINAALADVLASRPESIVFGEDVAVKGGVYGLTRGLRKKFGATRVFDTLLDEQTILGTALGAAVTGLLPIAEIQYLAYLHNAEDQLRGEAATLRFFSNGQYQNGMVVRVAGLAYQKGFGGHFHNDNSLAVLRDIPGLILAVPSHPADAPAMLRTCIALAKNEGRVCIFLEPIALYHTRDLHLGGDNEWTADYVPEAGAVSLNLGQTKAYGDGGDQLIVTYGNGLPMSLRAARALAQQGIDCTVLDLRWLAPLPVAELLDHARGFDHVLVADETRSSGGVSEAIITALVEHGYIGSIRRVTSQDCLVPLGPAADQVLLSEQQIVRAGAESMAGDPHRRALNLTEV